MVKRSGAVGKKVTTMKEISTQDVIWRFHVNPADNVLYLECKNAKKEFYLWEPEANKQWHFPMLKEYVCTLVNLQYPYVVLSYYHEQNLMNQSILMVYNLALDKEVWSSSELKLEECFVGELKVYAAKISPKRYEFISLEKEKIDLPKEVELHLDVQHAEKEASKHVLEFGGTRVELSIAEPAVLSVHQQNKEILNKEFDIEGIRMEYDYLLRIAEKIILLIDNQHLLVLKKLSDF